MLSFIDSFAFWGMLWIHTVELLGCGLFQVKDVLSDVDNTTQLRTFSLHCERRC